jgi:DNA polymerase I
LKTPRDFSPVVENQMVYFKTDKLGLLPRSVLELKTLRDEYKKRRNEAKDKRGYTKWENSQMAVKRLMASFYGIIAYQGFGWANVTLAAAITASAREAIREAAFVVRGLDG